jgi:hypothetical protein
LSRHTASLVSEGNQGLLAPRQRTRRIVKPHTLFDTLTGRLPETLGDSLRLLRHKSEFD